MSNALVPISDIREMAAAFAKSGLFGQKSPEQCFALMLLAHAEGVHPAIAMRDFDVINGRPAKKAEAMLRSFIDHDGEVKWHEMTDELADATFSHPKGGSVRLTWDMARAKKAGLGGKEMYSKFTRQMLANRVISEGCRRIYPASTSGMYEPGEVRQMAREDKQKEKDMGPAEVVKDDEPPAWDDEAQHVMRVSPEQAEAIDVALSQNGVELADFLRYFAKVESVRDLQQDRAVRAIEWIREQKTKREGLAAAAKKKPAGATAAGATAGGGT